MSEAPVPQVPQVPKRSPPAVTADIRSAALWLLIGGGLCLYFGLSLVVTAPASVADDPQATQHWFALNRTLNRCLAGVGTLFILAAALAVIGQRVAMLAATIVEILFALLLVVMSVSWTIEGRADGEWNYQVILLLILAVLGVGGVKRSWELYRAAREAGLVNRET